MRGTFDQCASYRRLDVVARNGGSFIALKDAPGPCPGPGWQLIASQGKRGAAGEKGERGAPGPKGDAGAATREKTDRNCYQMSLIREALKIVPQTAADAMLIRMSAARKLTQSNSPSF